MLRFELCLPTRVKVPPSGERWINEIKYDGFRLVARRDALADLTKTAMDPRAEEFRKPLQRDAEALSRALGPQGEPVLLGSIAATKYIDVLPSAFKQALLYPAEFVGRGDMSRGGLLLRSVDAHEEMTYVPVRGAVLRGTRPPKLSPRSSRFEPRSSRRR